MTKDEKRMQETEMFVAQQYFEYLENVATTCLHLGMITGICKEDSERLEEIAKSLYRVGNYIIKELEGVFGVDFEELEQNDKDSDKEELVIEFKDGISAVFVPIEEEEDDEKEVETYFYDAIEALNEAVANLFRYQMNMRDDWKESHQKYKLNHILEDGQRLVTSMNGFKYMYYGGK